MKGLNQMNETFNFSELVAMFLKGAKVKCIDGTFLPDVRLPYTPEEIDKPEKGKFYTIREVIETYGGSPGVLLEEIINSQFRFVVPGIRENRIYEPPFALSRFELY